MHGEYKVPGGKLVVADLDVAGGVLADVRVSGDFFLEPDEALDAINAALTGLPATADTRVLAERVDAGLGPDAVLLGFSAQAVAIAVRRALARATEWHDHDWHLVHEGPQDPAMHMAIDEVLAVDVAAGRRPPTLRIWEWAKPCVVIGSFQSLRNEVDGEGAHRHGIEVVRRISGGGAMFIEPGNTITYSLYAPTSLIDGMSFADSYAYLDDWVLGAFNEDLGVRAWYQPLNDITSDGGKIGGAAQKRLATGSVLHHVTMAYDIDADKMLEVLRIGREKLSDKGTTSAGKRVDPLRRQTGLPRTEIVDRMVAHFRRRYGLVNDTLTANEQQAAADLVATKFGTAEWTARIP
ncbi:lipoate-protein ligase A [Actinopolymorpha cephalotaxi]|uniref:Lipoate-protein ligase A n=1 Tax=Actinopolymorpha cephalotaxi TaxID=504797 RepID=A0A1I2TCZ8_9ACTN|nr:biotin/lipoate A/B protein ligase family protein [Actinopolymorpha cephalotaxi]NYH83036.1 lipoate-protein ligase A [Actinopolymorpha cephalotaxi]SFG62894.1 lipoate-protein ligase A [Actinopolymorpha cephalotaxi]